jgi:TonB family protein
MKHIVIIALLLAAATAVTTGQTEKAPPQKGQDKQLEQQPFPVGGVEAIGKAVKYPEAARKDSVQGVVYVEATVDQEGNVIKAVALKGVRADVDKAAVDAVKSIKFKPGMHEGKPVEAIVTVPIAFRLK